MEKKQAKWNSFLSFVRIRKYAMAITIAIAFLNVPSIALGVVQCYCRGQYYNFNDDRNCRDWCVGSQPSSSPSPQPSYTPSGNNDNSRQHEQQLQRQREEEDRQQRIAEEKKRREEFEKKKQDTLNEIRDPDKGEFHIEGFGGDGNFGFTDMGDKENAESEKLRKGWQKALGCAMKEVYDRAESLGPDGVRFAQELRNDMKRVFNEAGKPVKYKNDVNIVNLTQSREKSASGGSGSAERQFIVSILVSTNDKSEIVMIIESYLSKSADKTDKHADLQSILILNKHGKVTESQISKEVRNCLAH